MMFEGGEKNGWMSIAHSPSMRHGYLDVCERVCTKRVGKHHRKNELSELQSTEAKGLSIEERQKQKEIWGLCHAKLNARAMNS